MKITIDWEKDGLVETVYKDVYCFGLCGFGMVNGKPAPITSHGGDPIVVSGLMRILEICLEPHVRNRQKELT